MSKLLPKDKFLDLSDYGRPAAVWITGQLKNSYITPIHITLMFGIVGLMAVYCIISEYFFIAGILLILKSILDAADGELSRAKKKPSHAGRYLDSIFDIILNILIFGAICYVTKSDYFVAVIAIVCIQLQGTLYNYYYATLRSQTFGADSTTRVFEYSVPLALKGEKQSAVTILFIIYTLFYGLFDRAIYLFDHNASKGKKFPNWFMTGLSIYGLGFQLLIIALMLNMNLIQFVIPFFIVFSAFIPIFIFMRKFLFGTTDKNSGTKNAQGLN